MIPVFVVIYLAVIAIKLLFDLEAMDKLKGMKTPQLVREALAEFMGTLILCVSLPPL